MSTNSVGAYIYTTMSKTYMGGNFEIFNHPTQGSFMVFGGGVNGIHIYQLNNIGSISITNPPSWISSSGCNGTIQYLTIDYGHLLVYGVGTVLSRWSIADPYNPTLLSQVSIGSYIQPYNDMSNQNIGQAISFGNTGVYVANRHATTGTYYGLGNEMHQYRALEYFRYQYGVCWLLLSTKQK